MWNELTILWNEMTIDWNDLTMERNDHKPLRQLTKAIFDLQKKETMVEQATLK